MEAEWAEVRALEAEIAALRRVCKEPPGPREEISGAQKSFQEIYQSHSEGWESSKDLRLQLGHLESELSFLSTLTGINIKNYYKKTEVLTSPEITEKSISFSKKGNFTCIWNWIISKDGGTDDEFHNLKMFERTVIEDNIFTCHIISLL